jgi:Ribosomal protein L11 methyltransferase (PrmA)
LQSILFRPGITDDQRELLIVDLWEQGTAGILEGESGMRAFFVDPVVAARISERYAPLVINIREESPAPAIAPPSDCDPILVGTKFFVVPRGSKHATPAGRARLELDGAAAFGTGRHETTQLVMEALETRLRPGATVIDLGCGSGILSLAASALGAGHVIGCDIYPEAVSAAGQRWALPVFQGTIDAVRTGVADLVLANISARVLDGMASDLNRIARPDGTLILSGFIRDKMPTRFQPEWATEKDEWLCWVCRPDKSKAGAGEHQRGLAALTEQWW